MMRRSTSRIEVQESELERLIHIGKKHRQLGLYLYIYWHFMRTGDGAPLHRLHKFYNRLASRPVHENTIRKQLELLEAKGLVELHNGKVYPKIMDIEAALSTFDSKRSRAGRKGAAKALRHFLYFRTGSTVCTEIPKSLKHYIATVIRKARELASKGRREVVLDLLIHILLPIRETGVLWIWKGDEFIYYEKKIGEKGQFHSVRFPLLAEFLRSLGFQEGLMIYHIYGHREASTVIHKLFSRGPYSWPWARSVFYKLKELGLASEGNYYIIELLYRGGTIYIYLKDSYGNTMKVYNSTWLDTENIPTPLDKEHRFKGVVVGRQHIKEENENSYFSRWR